MATAAVAEVAKEFDLECRDCVAPLEQARFEGLSRVTTTSNTQSGQRIVATEYVTLGSA
jgi:hypothetical protein